MIQIHIADCFRSSILFGNFIFALLNNDANETLGQRNGSKQGD